MENNMLKEYFYQFGEYPPLIMELPYGCDDYQALMMYAIDTNTKITEEVLADYIKRKNIKYGVRETGEDDNNMEEQKIRKLLKQYGAEDVEIENFMTDLKDMKDEAEEENLLIANADKLKATQEGREIIKNAPTMAKDELAKKIKEFLQ